MSPQVEQQIIAPLDRAPVALELANPLDGALMLASRGVPQAPGEIKSKKIYQHQPTTDAAQIVAANEQKPGRNFGSYAVAEMGGFCFFEVDSRDVVKRIKDETGHDLYKETGFKVRSSPGKGHIYLRQTPASIACGNISQRVVKFGDWSLRIDGEYVISAGGVRPDGSVYKIIDSGEIPEAPDWLIKWCQSQKAEKKSSPNDPSPLIEGSRNTTLASIAGKYRDLGENAEDIKIRLMKINEERCVPQLPLSEIESIANSIGRYEDGITKRSREIVLSNGVPMGTKAATTPAPVYAGTLSSVDIEDDASADSIPLFDRTVINGIYSDFVELMTRGTTLAPQFAFVIAKTVVGIRMAGKVKFENLDVEPRLYTALIGETGSGKGEAWRRMAKILNPGDATNNPSGIKVINSADSGAGIRDVFIDQQTNAVMPVLMFIDEVESFGNKGNASRNPAIIDMLIELADSTSLSRVLSGKKSGGEKSTSNARLCSVLCGQDGPTYMKAFAGRTKLGLWDRLYPEYGEAVEAGDLPAIEPSDAFKLLAKLNALDYSGTMTMDESAKMWLEDFWNVQPVEVRKKVRWKKALMLDAFLSAFGRGSKIVELEDIDIAIRIFQRQLVIRRVCFTSEVPDRTGYYLGLVKRLTERMRKQLAAGMNPDLVALSRRDYEKRTNATRDNEEHLFAKAWDIHQKVHLMPYEVVKANGHRYSKFLPIPEEE